MPSKAKPEKKKTAEPWTTIIDVAPEQAPSCPWCTRRDQIVLGEPPVLVVSEINGQTYEFRYGCIPCDLRFSGTEWEWKMNAEIREGHVPFKPGGQAGVASKHQKSFGSGSASVGTETADGSDG